MYDPRNNPIAGDQPVISTGDALPVSPSGSDVQPVATASGPLPVSPTGADIQPPFTPAGDVSPIPGQALGESLHGNVEDASGIFYGDVGVDRDIDATASHTFSDGHHPLRNPVPETAKESDLTYLDDTEVSHHGVATSVQLGSTAGTTTDPTASDLQTREQGADTGDPRYALSPDTAVDPPQDLESEGRTGTEVGSTLQDSVYGAGQHNQSVSTSASGPISEMDAPSANIALGAFGMPGGQQLKGEQAAMMQPATQGGFAGSDGRPQQSGSIHTRGGDADGFAYDKQDDQNPEPTENIAADLGEKYIVTNVANNHGEVHANLATANVASAIAELRSIGIQDADISVLNEGNIGVVKVKVDNLNRPYVEQTLHKYEK